MPCPDANTLLTLVEMDAPPPDLEMHVAGCARCAGEVRSARAARARVEGARPVPDPRFVRRVLERVAAAEDRRRWVPRRWLLVAPAVVVAALAVSVSLRDGADRPVARGAGTAGPGRLLGLELRLHRAGATAGIPARSGDHLAPGDGLSAVVYNRTGGPAELCLFAVDAAGAVHWVYPAYARAVDDPISLGVPAQPPVRELPEGVTLEAPAAGPLVVTALFVRRPVRVSEVEAAVARRGLQRLGEVLPVVARQSFDLVVPGAATRSSP
jgi:hypothetical protein